MSESGEHLVTQRNMIKALLLKPCPCQTLCRSAESNGWYEERLSPLKIKLVRYMSPNIPIKNLVQIL